MAAIYLKHELHGTKVAISEAEALADERNGWSRFDINESNVVEDQHKEAPQVSNTLRLKRPYNRRNAA